MVKYAISDNSIDNNKLNNLLLKAVNGGDSKAYNEFAASFILEERLPELYYYALIMANKYHNGEAYYHLYLILTNTNNIDGVQLGSDDNDTKNLSLYYLMKAYELGNSEAIEKANTIFTQKKTIKRPEYYLDQLDKK
jgi:TPR repeat protein